MSVESTREALTRYLAADAPDATMLADNVVFTVMATGQEVGGLMGVRGLLNYFYHQAFDARGVTHNLMIDDGRGVWEGELAGRHVGDFAGIPATGKQVRVPLCVVYDLENDKIVRARIYIELPVLYAQLGMALPGGG